MSDPTGKPIPVTRPYLPPLEEVTPYLEQIWDSRILTNGGPLHQQLEEALCKHLAVPHISLFNNGTIALVTAAQALGLKGEVITTPYSFVATANALVWNNITPVFVDIDPDTLNLDPSQIEAAITPRTTGIMPVHCYGNPCDVDAIDEIAARHGLKVIYDAAHAFGVNCHCGSVLNHGDLSVLSFHATKVFNTFEGGAIVSHDQEMKQRIDGLRNFGLAGEAELQGIGLNGKMNEFCAAIGLVQLPQMINVFAERRRVDSIYRDLLQSVPGIQCLPRAGQTVDNYAYFPILVGPEYPLSRDALYKRLRHRGVLARKYFFPTVMQLLATASADMAEFQCPVTERAAERALCLPIYPELVEQDIQFIARLISDPVDTRFG